jgi:hypothetical protein
VSEAIDKQIAGQVVAVTIEPKADRKKLDKAISDEVKKSPVEVPIEPKIDVGKVGKNINDAVSKGLDPKAVGKTVSDALNKGIDAKAVGKKLDDALSAAAGKAKGALKAAYNSELGQELGKTVGEELGKAIGEKVGQAIGNTAVGQWARNIADNVQPAAEGVRNMADALAQIRQGDAAGGLQGVANAVNQMAPVAKQLGFDMSSWPGPISETAAKAGELQDNFVKSKTGIQEFAGTVSAVSPGIAASLAKWAGPLAAILMALDKAQPAFDHIGALMSKDPAVFDKANEWHGNPQNLPPTQRNARDNPPPVPGVNPSTGLRDLNKIPVSQGGLGPELPGRATGGMADGLNGLIRGPGTGKSDSILGWPAMVRVSNGEFLTNEESTRRNLPLLQAVNSGAPLWDWMKSLPRFDTGGLVAGSAQLRQIISERFGIADIGGYRPADKYGEHSTGRALDVMVGNDKAKGDAVKDFALANAPAIDLKWVIWRQHLYYAGGGGYDMPDRGSPTQNHMDHVHIFSGTGIVSGLLGALQGKGATASPSGPGRGDDAVTPAGLTPAGGAAPASPAGTGGFSIPTSLSGLSTLGFDGLGVKTKVTPDSPERTFDIGNVVSAAVGGQVSSALGAFGVPNSPHWLQGISQLVGGISIGGPGSGGPAPASLRAGAVSRTAAPVPAAVGAGQQPGPQTVYNIKTARVEDAFTQAWRREKEKAATPLEHW